MSEDATKFGALLTPRFIWELQKVKVTSYFSKNLNLIFKIVVFLEEVTLKVNGNLRRIWIKPAQGLRSTI